MEKKVEYICAPDEGHGFKEEINKIAQNVAMEKFFSKSLGGRMQKEVRSDIQKRLDAITVDIKEVVVTSEGKENASSRKGKKRSGKKN